jgi:tetratricopeptide (TPR) repeat protein
LNELKESISNYQTTLKINKNHTDALNNLAKVYKELNQLNKAKFYYEECLSIEPDKKDACIGYSNLLLKMNDHIGGLKYLQKGAGIIRFNNGNVEII